MQQRRSHWTRWCCSRKVCLIGSAEVISRFRDVELEWATLECATTGPIELLSCSLAAKALSGFSSGMTGCPPVPRLSVAAECMQKGACSETKNVLIAETYPGSRLPAPLAWSLLEPWHPGTTGSEGTAEPQGGNGGAGSSAADAVGAALTWLLGLEAAGSACMAAIPAGAT